MKMDSESLTSLPIKEVSYLRARDPSILAWNRPGLAKIRTNLRDEMSSANSSEPKENEDAFRVYLRIKEIPHFSADDFKTIYEIQGDNLICKVPPGSHVLRNIKEGELLKKTYTFTKIFVPGVTQTDIFNSVVKPKVLNFINGQNSTLMTYGASGSGKTFTLIGTSEEPGLIPRSLEYLFRTIPNLAKRPLVKPLPTGEVVALDDSGRKKEKQICRSLLSTSFSVVDKAQHVRTYTEMQQRLSSEPFGHLDDHSDVSVEVWVSFAEIYNEHIYDLLQPDPPRGKQRPKLKLGSARGQSYIKNLTSVNVSSGLEAYQILQYGIHNVNYAATNINSHSSRSHSIFTIKLIQASRSDGGVHVSSFNFCDLAGSERSKKTLNVGDRMKESQNINNSLLVLGRCISTIRNSQKHNDHKLVPFRESKLTQLFQRALSGTEDIAMIVTVSPLRDVFDESHHVLNFAAVAKDISLERPAEEVIRHQRNNRFSRIIESHVIHEESEYSEMEDELERLRTAVSMLQQEIVTQKVEMESDKAYEQQYLRKGYDELLEEMQEHAKQKLRKREMDLKREHEEEVARLKAYYERLLREKDDIISLDSSDDEDEEDAKQTKVDFEAILEEYKKMLESEMAEKERLVMESLELKQRNLVLESQLAAKEKANADEELKAQISELKKTIDDGVVLYRELESRFKEKDEENLALRKKCLTLECELAEKEIRIAPSTDDEEDEDIK